MKIEEYLGILTSPSAPQKQKQRAINKLKKCVIQLKESFQLLPKKPSKYGGISIFVTANKQNRIYDIPAKYVTFTVLLTPAECRMEAEFEGHVFRFKKYKEFKEFKKGLIIFSKKIEEKIDEKISHASETPYVVPQLLFELLKSYSSSSTIIDTYDVRVEIELKKDPAESNVSVKVIPVSKIIHAPGIDIEVNDKISWYPESAINRVILEFAKRNKDYVALMKDDTMWAFNEEYAFWRYKIYHHVTKDGEKVYRTKYDPGKQESFCVYGDDLILFKIKDITAKSAWLVPVKNPVQFLLKQGTKTEG